MIRWGLEELPPLLMGALRFLFVAFPAIFFVARPKLPFKWLFAYAITISFGQFALLFSAMYLGMPAGLASVVLQAQALFTLIFAMLFLGEHLRIVQCLSLGVALMGLVLLGSEVGGCMTILGFMLTIAAASTWGLGNIINRQIAQHHSVNLVSLVVWAGLIPPIPFMLMSLWFEGPELIVHSLNNMGWQSVGVLAYLSLIASVFGYGGWAYLLKHNPASQVAPLTLLVPGVGLLSAWLILGEQLTLVQILGICVLMLGLMINVFGGRLIQRWRFKTAH